MFKLQCEEDGGGKHFEMMIHQNYDLIHRILGGCDFLPNAHSFTVLLQ